MAPLNETNRVSYMNKDIMTFERDRVESVEQEPRPNPYVHGQTFVGDGVNELPNAYEGPQGSRPTQYLYNQASVGDGLDYFIGAREERPGTRPTPYLQNPAHVGDGATNLADVVTPCSAAQGDKQREEETPVDMCMQVVSSTAHDVGIINLCMHRDPLYLAYVKDYRDVEQERPAIVPRAWYAEPLTTPDGSPTPPGAREGNPAPLPYQMLISGPAQEMAQMEVDDPHPKWWQKCH